MQTGNLCLHRSVQQSPLHARRPFNRKEYFYSFIRNKIQVPASYHICSPYDEGNLTAGSKQERDPDRVGVAAWATQTVRYRNGRRSVPNPRQREEGFRELRTAIKARCHCFKLREGNCVRTAHGYMHTVIRSHRHGGLLHGRTPKQLSWMTSSMTHGYAHAKTGGCAAAHEDGPVQWAAALRHPAQALLCRLPAIQCWRGQYLPGIRDPDAGETLSLWLLHICRMP